jgi:hypothetical protein
MAEVIVDKNGTTVVTYREEDDPTCDIDVLVDRATNTVEVAASYLCGLEDDPAGETLSFDLAAYVELTKAAPKDAEESGESHQFDLEDTEPA